MTHTIESIKAKFFPLAPWLYATFSERGYNEVRKLDDGSFAADCWTFKDGKKPWERTEAGEIVPEESLPRVDWYFDVEYDRLKFVWVDRMGAEEMSCPLYLLECTQDEIAELFQVRARRERSQYNDLNDLRSKLHSLKNQKEQIWSLLSEDGKVEWDKNIEEVREEIDRLENLPSGDELVEQYRLKYAASEASKCYSKALGSDAISDAILADLNQ